MYTVNEIAKLMGVNRETVRRWLQVDLLHGTKIGLTWFVDEKELARFREERERKEREG